MQIETQEQQKREGGFTLVELAIVMIIIGLLIGGILKGQELIANSQVTATISQIKGIDAAVSTFKDKYAMLPGDMDGAQNRLAACSGACVNNPTGAQDGRINSPATANTVPPIRNENAQVFLQLAASDLISGINIETGTATFGSGLPAAKVDGGFWIGYTTNGQINSLIAGADAGRPGHYLILNGTPANVGAATGAIPTTQAAQIDRKLDDGDADSGSIFGGTLGGCRGGGTYDEDGGGLCSMAIRIQG